MKRRVISKCPGTERIPSLSQMVKEAVEAFYEEFDYYPTIGVCAPGVFTIMGDHLEYVDGNLVQAASPFLTVIVGKSLNTVKCKVFTTAKDVEGFKKIAFPINYFHNKSNEIYPEWVKFLQGVMCKFPCKDLKGFDALIHSSIPLKNGYGSSAGLQVAFYCFLEATCGIKPCKNKEQRGKLCRQAELSYQSRPFKVGLWDNVTSSMAERCSGLMINCNKSEIYPFDMKEINILFLLTYPKFEIELNDRDLIERREMELKLIAKLLGLDHIKQATEKHMKILESMEDPSKEAVVRILQGLGYDEDTIFEFVDELFYFPKSPSILDEIYGGEADLYEIGGGEGSENNFENSEISEQIGNEDRIEDEKEYGAGPCMRPDKLGQLEKATTQKRSINYIHRLINDLCEGKTTSKNGIPVKICEEINCLGGIENLSDASDLSVIGRLLRRLRHVITEKNRSASLPEIIMRGDYVEFGTKLIQSHLSLKLDYEVSCPTLDGLVQLAIDTEHVYGAKMMSGGGTLTLIHRRFVEELIKKIEEKFGSKFQFYLMFPNPGARILNIGVKMNPKSALSNSYINREELMKKAVQNFEATYNYKPTHGAFSPGTVNLIGDHSDYNHGFSVSMAVSLLTVVVGAYNGTSKVRIVTTGDVGNEPRKVIFSLPAFEELSSGRIKWVKLLKGIINNFEGTLRGFDCLIESNVPSRSGIPSETALLVAFYTFLEELTELKTDLCKKAFICMCTEQDYMNTTRGAGDATVSVRTKEDHAILLDCRSLTSTLLPFQDTSVSLLLTSTGEKIADVRRLLYSRMEDCYKVARALGGKTLRCLTIKMLEGVKSSKISESALRRAKHVVLENERVLRSAEALKNNDFESLGELMVASHNSLRYNYEVTSPELDFLVERAMEVDGVLGSKMPCSGNASCTLTLVKRWAVDDLIEYLQNNFSEKLDFYIVTPYESCGSLDLKQYLDSIPGPRVVFEDIFPF